MSISAPAAWGKLPAYGDFVRQNATTTEVEDWQQWFAAFPVTAFGELSVKESSSGKPPTDWHSLEPREWHEKRIAHPLPWSFVIPPGVMPFAGNDFVVGVMTDSCDKVGRRHPFVIYQKATRAWLKRALAEPQNLPFWWARLLVPYTPPVLQQAETGPSISLETRLDQLWQLHRPNWLQRLGLGHIAPHLQASRSLVGIPPDNDPAQQLMGVTSPPWADWPQTLWLQTDLARFWQQDAQGRYVGKWQLTPRAPGGSTR